MRRMLYHLERGMSLFENREFLLAMLLWLRGKKMVRLDAASVCQLQCPECPTGQRKTKDMAVGWGSLKAADFRRFVDGNPAVKHIELSNWGELFLNPELEDIIRYAHKKSVRLAASNGSNLNTLSDEMAELLVTTGFRKLNVSLDGASDETYALYRRNGNFTRVIENVKKINTYKRKHKSRYPKLSWQFVVFGHNAHELPKARRMARSLGMRFAPKRNWSKEYAPLKNPGWVRKILGRGFRTRKQLRKRPAHPLGLPCAALWVAPQVNWDGKLLGCCVNTKTSFGNVFEEGLGACLRKPAYKAIEEALLGKRAMPADSPCQHCHYYTERIKPFMERS